MKKLFRRVVLAIVLSAKYWWSKFQRHGIVKIDSMHGNMKILHCKCGGRICFKVKTLRLRNLTDDKLILRREAVIIHSDCSEGLREQEKQHDCLISNHV